MSSLFAFPRTQGRIIKFLDVFNRSASYFYCTLYAMLPVVGLARSQLNQEARKRTDHLVWKFNVDVIVVVKILRPAIVGLPSQTACHQSLLLLAECVPTCARNEP